MEVVASFVDAEDDLGVGVEAVDSLLLEVVVDFESQSVDAGHEGMVVGEEVGGAAVGVGRGSGDGLEVAVLVLSFESDGDALCGLAGGGVENVCGEGAHGWASFVRRRRVIKRCCSAASASSDSGSRLSLDLRVSSISCALFPEAQMRKTKPKRDSYSSLRRTNSALVSSEAAAMPDCSDFESSPEACD